MGVIRYKNWYDLWKNRGRTLQVVLIVGMGAFAIGLIIGTRMLIIPRMHELWREVSPAMITLSVSPPVDDNTLKSLKKIEGVEAVEGTTQIPIEWRRSPEDEWERAFLIAREDYKNQRFTKIGLLSGEWPNRKLFAAIQGADTVFDIQEGDQVYIRVADREHAILVGGFVYDSVAQPPSFFGPLQFYTTRDRLEHLTGSRNFNRIMASAAVYDEEVVTELADSIQDSLDEQGIESGPGMVAAFGPPTRISDPDRHFYAPFFDAIFFIMGVMSILALILALFLVYNTINAIIRQQIDQIGVMKAIGASTGVILRHYLTTVFAYGLLALLFAIPMAAIGGWGLVVFLITSFNADPGTFKVSPVAIAAQVGIAMLTPLLTSLIPVFSGARVTVQEAMFTYGLSAKASLLDRLLARQERLSRQFLLMISNTFRKKGRVFLTQITLVLSGLIFMMVMSVRDSTSFTFNDLLFSIFRFNLNLSFEEPERVEFVEGVTARHPGVEAVEMWVMDGPIVRPMGQPEAPGDISASVFGIPWFTSLYGYQITAGRWLIPEDTAAVVVNERLAQDIGISLGDWITLDHAERGETHWQVVGLLNDPLIIHSVLAPRETLAKELGILGKANSVWIQTTSDDPAREKAIIRDIRQIYKRYSLGTTPGGALGADTASEIIAIFNFYFGFIIALLAIMALVIALVGSISLSGTLTLNVLERRREIGVLRAIGASSGSIARLMIGEGLILGWLSWVIALPLSIPAGRLMTAGLGMQFQLNILYQFEPTGPLLWLGIITFLSIIASWFPARGAMRISVQESLAYQ